MHATTRSATYTQAWSAENRLTAVTAAVGTTTTVVQFFYDADNGLVKRVNATSGQQTYYVGKHFEQVAGGNWTVYYALGGQRVALRNGNGTTSTVEWLHSDQLGSASLTTNASGAKVAEVRYKPFGETRYASGSLSTDRKFTGQRSEAAMPGSLKTENEIS